jgi:hypothetical protein
MLGETWQTFAQANTEQTRKWIAMAGEKRDAEVKEMMGDELRAKRVRLRPYGEDGKVGIYIDERW